MNEGNLYSHVLRVATKKRAEGEELPDYVTNNLPPVELELPFSDLEDED